MFYLEWESTTKEKESTVAQYICTNLVFALPLGYWLFPEGLSAIKLSFIATYDNG